MKIICTIARNDLKVVWREGVVQSLLVLTAVVGFYAALTGRAYVEREMAAHRRFVASEEANLAQHKRTAERVLLEIALGHIPDKHPPDYGPLHALYVKNFAILSSVLPPAPLGALSSGARTLQTQAHAIALYDNIFTFKSPEETESPLKLLAGRLDLVFVAASLYALAIISVTFSMTAGEREAGLLSLVLANPVSYRQFHLGKLMSRSLIVLGAAVVLLAAALSGAVGGPGANGVPWRLALWAIAIVLYGGFWLLLAWAINGLARPATWNALALAALWLVMTVVVPCGLRIGAAMRHPAAPRVESVETLRNASSLARTAPDRLREKFLLQYPQYRRNTPYPWMGNNQVVLAARSEEVAKAMETVSEKYEGQQRRQRTFVRKFAWLSPFLLLESVLENAAGSGFDRHEHYLAQVRGYHRRWQEFFWPRIFEETVFRPEDYDRMPRFQYREEAPNEVLARSYPPLLILLCWGVAMLVLGRVAHRRMNKPLISVSGR